MFGVIEGSKGGDQSPHTPVEATDTLRSVSYAKIADLLSEGDIYGFALGFDRALECIYLNKTPVGNSDGTTNFQRISVDSRSGTQSQTAIPGFSSVDNEVGVGLELKDTIPYTYTTTNLQLTALGVRISLPQGLQKSNPNGDITGYSIRYAIDLKVDSGAFVTVLDGAFTGKASASYEKSHRIELPAGATTGWSLRVRRITVNANSASIADMTQVVSVTESIDVKLRYPNSAYVFLQLDAAQFPSIPSRSYHIKGRIVKVPTNYDPDTRAYTGAWDGTFKLAYTNNPAWIYYDLVLHYRYGLGHLISAAQVDKWSLYPIAQYCDGLVPDGKGGMEPRFTCNVYIQKQQQAYALLQSLASAFRGVAFYAGGMVSASCDMPADPVALYTHANVVGGKFQYAGSPKKTRYTVALVSWNDPNDFYTQKVQYYQDPDGYARYGYQPTSMAAFGCTSQAMAARVGKWLTVSSRLEGEAVTFQIGLEGTFSLPGQIVRISDRARSVTRMAGRVKTVGSTNSVVKPDVMPTVGVGDSLTVTLPTGVTETRTVSAVGADTITVSPAFTSAPSSQGVWLVENSELTAPLWKIISIAEDTTGTGKTFTFTGVRHYAGKFDFIDLDIPITDPPIIGTPERKIAGPAAVAITSNQMIGPVTAQTVLTVQWTKVVGATAYSVQWKRDNGNWQSTGGAHHGVSADIPSNLPGTYKAIVWATNATGAQSLPVMSEDYIVPDMTTLPTDIGDIQTTANAASAASTAANAALADIASDSKITPVEKPEVIQQVNKISSDQPLWDAQAVAFGVTTEKDAYDSKITALSAYLATLTVPVLWSDLSGTTNVVGATFRQKFLDVYTAQQALINALFTSSLNKVNVAFAAAAAAQDTADGKIVTYYQSTAPTTHSLGDLWLDTGHGNRLSRWNGSSWVVTQDTAISTAITNAAGAQATADGKVTTYFQVAAPTATALGDLWYDSDDAVLNRWNGSAWIAQNSNIIKKNLLVNPTGMFDFDGWDGGWIGGSRQRMICVKESTGFGFGVSAANTSGIDMGVSQFISVVAASNVVTLSALMYSFHVNTGSHFIEMRFNNTSGVEIDTSNRPRITSDNNYNGVKRYSVTATAPAGTVQIQIIMRASCTFDGAGNLSRWYDIKVEQSAFATPFSDDATPKVAPQDTTYVNVAGQTAQQARLGLRVSGSGHRVGSQNNLPASLTGAFGAVNTTAALSATSAGAVSVNAFTMRYGSFSVSYSAVSNAVTGLAVSQTYAIYCIDETYAGGARTWLASNNSAAVMNLGDGVIVAGTITIPSSGTGTGGGTGWCVTDDTILPGYDRADAVIGGHSYVDVVDLEHGRVSRAFVEQAECVWTECVRLTTRTGIEIECSTSAAFAVEGGKFMRAKDMHGALASVMDFGVWGYDEVVEVLPLGRRRVVSMSCQNSYYLAGKRRGRYFAHHNRKMDQP